MSVAHKITVTVHTGSGDRTYEYERNGDGWVSKIVSDTIQPPPVPGPVKLPDLPAGETLDDAMARWVMIDLAKRRAGQ